MMIYNVKSNLLFIETFFGKNMLITFLEKIENFLYYLKHKELEKKARI